MAPLHYRFRQTHPDAPTAGPGLDDRRAWSAALSEDLRSPPPPPGSSASPGSGSPDIRPSLDFLGLSASGRRDSAGRSTCRTSALSGSSADLGGKGSARARRGPGRWTGSTTLRGGEGAGRSAVCGNSAPCSRCGAVAARAGGDAGNGRASDPARPRPPVRRPCARIDEPARGRRPPWTRRSCRRWTPPWWTWGSGRTGNGVVVAFRTDLADFASLERARRSPDCPWFGVDRDPLAPLRDEWGADEFFLAAGRAVRHAGADAAAGPDRRTKRPSSAGETLTGRNCPRCSTRRGITGGRPWTRSSCRTGPAARGGAGVGLCGVDEGSTRVTSTPRSSTPRRPSARRSAPASTGCRASGWSGRAFEDLEPHDCFVTAGNAFGLMTAGIDAAVVRFFGERLMQRSSTGSWTSTSASNRSAPRSSCRPATRRCPFVCHAPTMRVPGSIEGTDKVYAATWAALLAIQAHNRCRRGRRSRRSPSRRWARGSAASPSARRPADGGGYRHFLRAAAPAGLGLRGRAAQGDLLRRGPARCPGYARRRLVRRRTGRAPRSSSYARDRSRLGRSGAQQLGTRPRRARLGPTACIDAFRRAWRMGTTGI